MKKFRPVVIKLPLNALSMRITAFAMLFSMQSCLSDKKIDFDKRINAVKMAFEQKKMDSLQPYLANGYTIKGLPEGMESVILPMMLEKLPRQEKYVITDSKEEKRGTRLKVTFYDASNREIKSNFLIAKDGKFLELNLLEEAKISTEINK